MILTLMEIFDIIVMTVILGFVFMNFFRRPLSPEDYLKIGRFDWQSFKFACIVIAPAVILHEFGHKIVALSFGMQATFNAAYFWLFIALMMRLLRFPFIFFVPAYVSIIGNTTPLQSSIIAFSGPFVNLLLWIGSWIVLRTMKIKKKYIPLLVLTSRINMFLFIFNMLPIPGFDGSHVFKGLLNMF